MSERPGDLHVELTDSEAFDEVHFLDDRLYEFNMAATGIRDGRNLRIFVRDAEGRLVAGLTGDTWGEVCEIRQVWVADAYRGRGLGRDLLSRAEAEARARRCRRIFVMTHTFQAPDFYRKLGFEVRFELADKPMGHGQIGLVKRLDATP